LDHSKNMWVVSQKPSDLPWIISNYFELYQPSFWVRWIDSYFTWYYQSSNHSSPFQFCLYLSESIQTLSESIHSVVFGWKFALAILFYIYWLPHNTKIIESFASILSRSQKLVVHKFFKIKHFFLESLCTLSHIDFLGSK
jgi:hypothetical protein